MSSTSCRLKMHATARSKKYYNMNKHIKKMYVVDQPVFLYGAAIVAAKSMTSYIE